MIEGTTTTDRNIARPLRILAVDDSLTFRHVLRERLEEHGFAVATAASGEEALAYIAKHEVDCVLLDMVMPGLSGQETCRRIRQEGGKHRTVPILMLTSLDGTSPVLDALRAGADDFITKGDDPALLTARLEAQLRRRRLDEETRHMREELHAAQLRASKAETERELAETRARLLEDLAAKNQELERAKERAEASVRARDEFLSIASHELRTPVTALWLQIERLQSALRAAHRDVSTDDLRPMVERMMRQLGRLATLIDALLDASRIGAGRFALRLERIDLAAAVRTVAGDLEEAAQRAGSTIDLRLESPLVGLWDPLRVEQMTMNLVHNAIKYGAGKPIDLRLERVSGVARLTVTDRGIGIAEEHQARIFSIFERAVSPRNYGGLGLGLYIARHIVEEHGGSIRVASRPGEGASFVVDLPIGEVSASAA